MLSSFMIMLGIEMLLIFCYNLIRKQKRRAIMTDLELELVEIIRRCPDPDLAINIAVKVIIDFLSPPSPSQEQAPFYPRQYA